MGQVLFSDPADLFVQLYDGLDEAIVRDPEAEAWLDDEGVSDIASLIEGQALETGRIDTEWLEESLDLDETPAHRFAVLHGLDLAFDSASLLTATHDQSESL